MTTLDSEAHVSVPSWQYSACYHPLVCQDGDAFSRGMEASCMGLSQTSCYMLLLLADSDLYPFAVKKNVIISIELS